MRTRPEDPRRAAHSERALRHLEVIEARTSEIFHATAGLRPELADEASGIAAEAEAAVLHELARDPEGVVRRLARRRRWLRGMLHELERARRARTRPGPFG